MGTIIKSVSFLKPFAENEILAMTARISKRCLKEAGLLMDDIGMLINTSVYSADHRCEPALASLIQNRLEGNGIGVEENPDIGQDIFSFDLHNGGGGTITAIQILDGFIQSGQIANGMIIAGDSRPQSGHLIHYPYENSAGALLLSDDPHIKGFAGFASVTYPEFEDDYQSVIDWRNGQLTLEITQKESYLQNCLLCAENSILPFLHAKDLKPEDLDLVITSTSPGKFTGGLQQRLPWKKNAMVNGTISEFYSSGLLYSLHNAFSGKRFTEAKYILFVNAGPGITISLSLYINH